MVSPHWLASSFLCVAQLFMSAYDSTAVSVNCARRSSHNELAASSRLAPKLSRTR